MPITKRALASKRVADAASRTEHYSRCGRAAARSLPNSTHKWNFYIGGGRRAVLSIETRDRILVRDLLEALAGSAKRGEI